MLPVLLLGAAALGAAPPPPPPRALFRCQPGPGAQGGPPPPPPNATSCVALGCRWDGQHCALRSPFARLLFADEFDGRAVNGSSWAVWDYRANMSPGRVRTNAAHDMVYAADAVTVSGGALTITSARHAAPLRVAPNASAHYTTGRLQTQSRRSWGPYGQFEARARVPRARGTNNAVWLMPQSFGSGASTYTEFDIAEILGRDSGTAHGTYHWGAPAGPLHHRSGGEYIDKAGLSEGFHMCDHCPRSNLCSLAHPIAARSYGIIWTARAIYWYVDDVIYHTCALPANATRPSVFFILQTNIGSNWAGRPVASDFPAEMVVDFVRVLGPAD